MQKNTQVYCQKHIVAFIVCELHSLYVSCSQSVHDIVLLINSNTCVANRDKTYDIHLMSCHELQHICFVPWIGDGTAMNDHGDMILVTYFFLLVTYFFLLVTYFFLLVTNELLLVTYK